jgi:hypothetical protein
MRGPLSLSLFLQENCAGGGLQDVLTAVSLKNNEGSFRCFGFG